MRERLQKIISAAGIASRRDAEELVLAGDVSVNGAVITELGAKADPDTDHIKVRGKLINPRQPKTYLMLNKPVGFVTTLDDPQRRLTVKDLLKGVKVRVYPVGRLDYNTEGLLLMTNDGDFAHLITHPSYELPKTYLAKIKGALTDAEAQKMEQGLFLRDGKTAPARVKLLRKEEVNSWVEVTIHEGRKRQVRRMFDHLNHTVIRLKRVKVGSLSLGDLAPGSYRHLSAEEVNALRDLAAGKAGLPSLARPAKPAASPARRAADARKPAAAAGAGPRSAARDRSRTYRDRPSAGTSSKPETRSAGAGKDARRADFSRRRPELKEPKREQAPAGRGFSKQAPRGPASHRPAPGRPGRRPGSSRPPRRTAR